MHNNPLISILVCSYNNSESIINSVESLQLQTYENLEILLLDDKSTDDTKEKINYLTNKYKNIRPFFNESNIGLTKSLNKLIDYANGELVARHDSDDFSLPNRFEKQWTIFDEMNLDFCTSRATIVNTNRPIPGLSFYLPVKQVMKFKNPFIHGTLLIKKSLLIEVGKYNERYIYAQDYELFSRLLNQDKKFSIIKDPLYELNMNGNISTLKKDEQAYYAKCVKKGLEPNGE